MHTPKKPAKSIEPTSRNARPNAQQRAAHRQALRSQNSHQKTWRKQKSRTSASISATPSSITSPADGSDSIQRAEERTHRSRRRGPEARRTDLSKDLLGTQTERHRARRLLAREQRSNSIHCRTHVWPGFTRNKQRIHHAPLQRRPDHADFVRADLPARRQPVLSDTDRLRRTTAQPSRVKGGLRTPAEKDSQAPGRMHTSRQVCPSLGGS